MRRSILAACVTSALALAWTCAARAQESEAELAKQLANPVASLISVPFQENYDCCFGPLGGGRYTLNIQPVVPVSLSPDWNLIVRTILPVIYQDRTSPLSGDTQGLGDTLQSFFLSPVKPVGGFILAAGPAFLWPTGEAELGSKTWGAGPTALILKQQGGTTYGLLVNHISVLRRPRRLATGRGQPDLRAAVLQLDQPRRHHHRDQHREHLQLGNPAVVDPDQPHRQPRLQVRQPTRIPGRRDQGLRGPRQHKRQFQRS